MGILVMAMKPIWYGKVFTDERTGRVYDNHKLYGAPGFEGERFVIDSMEEFSNFDRKGWRMIDHPKGETDAKGDVKKVKIRVVPGAMRLIKKGRPVITIEIDGKIVGERPVNPITRMAGPAQISNIEQQPPPVVRDPKAEVDTHPDSVDTEVEDEVEVEAERPVEHLPAGGDGGKFDEAPVEPVAPPAKAPKVSRRK